MKVLFSLFFFPPFARLFQCYVFSSNNFFLLFFRLTPSSMPPLSRLALNPNQQPNICFLFLKTLLAGFCSLDVFINGIFPPFSSSLAFLLHFCLCSAPLPPSPALSALPKLSKLGRRKMRKIFPLLICWKTIFR